MEGITTNEYHEEEDYRVAWNPQEQSMRMREDVCTICSWTWVISIIIILVMLEKAYGKIILNILLGKDSGFQAGGGDKQKKKKKNCKYTFI